MYLRVVLFYLCHSLKNTLGPITALYTEVLGFLSLYAGIVIDFLTMLNMKSYQPPCSRATQPYTCGHGDMSRACGGNPMSPLFSHQTDAVCEKTCHRLEPAQDRSIQTSFKKYYVA